MSELERNRALAHRLHQEIIQEHRPELADEIIHPDCIIHTPVADPRPGKGPQVAKDMEAYDRDIFPEGVKFDHYNTIAEGNLVSFCWTGKGKYKNGKPVEIRGIDTVRIADGKIAEVWVAYDLLGVQKQVS